MGWFEDGTRGSDRERDRAKEEKKRWTVGESYPELVTDGPANVLDYAGDSLILYVLRRGWPGTALEEYRADKPAYFHWAALGGVGFFCMKFGQRGWEVTPIHPGYFKALGRNATPPQIGEIGTRLSVICAESSTGKVSYIRNIRLSREFSIAVIQWLVAESGKEMSIDSFQNRVASVCAAYSATQLAMMADSRFVFTDGGACSL